MNSDNKPNNPSYTVPRVSVIIPAKNEEQHISDVLTKIPKDIFEVIVVDDGSSDNTVGLAKNFSVNIITLGKSRGKGAALKKGLLQSKGELIVFLDGDGQHDPSKINDIVQPILDGKSHMVIGNRFHNGYAGTPFPRIISNYLTRKIIKLVSPYEIPDPLCGFRAFRREKILSVHFGDGFDIELTSIFHFLKREWMIDYVSIPLIYSDENSSLHVTQDINLTSTLLYCLIRHLFLRIFGRN